MSEDSSNIKNPPISADTPQEGEIGEAWVKHLHRDRGDHESGFTIVELMAAVSVLAIGFLSLAGAMGLGLRQVGLARQRQSAAEIANARLEHLRNLPYNVVALSSQPVHNTDVTDPDYDVSISGETYEIPGASPAEPLIVDAASGQLLHYEDPVTVGVTEMKIYQYVTWVDDTSVTGTQDYKRVTIAVAFKFPSIEGVTRIVRTSAFVTTQTVIVNGTAATPQIGASASPTASASPSPTPTGTCPGDTSPPSGDFSIQSGTGSETGYTTSTSVTIKLSATDACAPLTAQFSNDGTTFGGEITLLTNVEHASWTVGSGDGTKQIWVRFADGAGNAEIDGPLSIVLDTTKPSTPGTLTYTKSCSGQNRTVNLSWGASTDTNFRGYRVYKSVNSGTWTAIGTVSTTSMSDTDSKSLDSLRYYVVGYDKAGNESLESNIVSLTKNQC